MSRLLALQSASSLIDVAQILGFSPSGLSFVLYVNASANYREFHIPKSNGESRLICAPTHRLKKLQRRLATYLQDCVDEINREKAVTKSLSHGFKRKHSIATNAYNHKRKRYVLNIDIEDFFGSINFGRVRGYFIHNRNFELAPSVATILAQIACHKNSLPQGAPTSPVISNLIGHIVDIKLVGLASKFGCSYSRYVDDISFSTNEKNFPVELAFPEHEDTKKWVAGKELNQAVGQVGFKLNNHKTRVQYRESRQDVTGLVVNRKVNVNACYRHTVRAMAHRLFMTGEFFIKRKAVDAAGSEVLYEESGKLAQLNGMLNFIDQIDQFNSKKATKSHSRLPVSKSRSDLYHKFLIYKDFYAADRPTVICEGKTDIVYLKCALKSQFKKHPKLIQKTDSGSLNLKIRLYKYTDVVGRVLGLTGGCPPLTRFVNSYKNHCRRFKAPITSYPVIVLVDNDEAGRRLVSNTKGIACDSITGAYHMTCNLYVCVVPKLHSSDTKIEDYFPKKWLKKKLGGKSFEPNEDQFDKNKHFSKQVFAEKVIKPNQKTIRFREFDRIFNLFTKVIDEAMNS